MPVVFKSGDLRRRVTLQQRSTAQSTSGEQSETWTNVATVWGSVDPVSGNEHFDGEAVKAPLLYDISIRYRTGVTPAMRISYGGRIFNILSVMDQEELHRLLIMRCVEGLNQG